ncbi:hypothetical protein MIND_01352700 [Mycena indigotica]|uniref:Uncharacterized protein n=1 Tax=Mycena indigotica TaxID=2126181 RepID=A0A8H6S045_9AGAR|nr:uncharacterized protein MIND_01352700 [Mycena indigotica]KAF7289785.1 hypothetical protein MIND_01352700 [Mycena indigotica]
MAVLTLLFMLAMILWAMDLTSFIWEAKFVLIKHPESALEDKLDAAYNFQNKVVLWQTAIYDWMAWIGDAIIVHRVWMLKAYLKPWIIAVPGICLLGTLIATLMLTYCTATASGADIALGSFTHPPLCKNAHLITYILPALTTAAATILIGITAW